MESIGAVVLAAGLSSRMGRPKQVLQFRGQSLLRGACVAALGGGCSPVIVVTGAYAELSRSELNALDALEAFNPGWQTGMASSIRTGLEGLLAAKPAVAAAVFLLCDQPRVTGQIIAGLIDAYRLTGKPVIASSYAGTLGVPALFGRSLFAEVMSLQGNAGAKHVIEGNASDAHFVPFPGGEVDLDTPEDVFGAAPLSASRSGT
jgi:molybdenum cofactor cytidylyltransferase